MLYKIETTERLALTVEIVSAHISNNTVTIPDLPSLIHDVYNSLGNPGMTVDSEVKNPVPAVPIKKSIRDGYLICLEDGRKLKMLKRYLKTNYNMTPTEYRKKWGLSSDYPMVAPAYAVRRSQLARDIGLGVKTRHIK